MGIVFLINILKLTMQRILKNHHKDSRSNNMLQRFNKANRISHAMSPLNWQVIFAVFYNSAEQIVLLKYEKNLNFLKTTEIKRKKNIYF